MLKCISQIKRLSTPFVLDEPLTMFATIRNVRVQKVDELTKRVITKVEKRTIDRAEEMKPYRVSDFCLDNLISIGAKMTPTHMAASPHKAISDMAATLETIDSNINNDTKNN